MSLSAPKPKFLSYKYQISRLSSGINVHDSQLRAHFLNSTNLYTLQCDCSNHKHNKVRCIISDDRECEKCETPTRLLVPFQSLLFHGHEFLHKELYTCCKHVHRPPCGRCLNCNTYVNGERQPCMVKEPFECNFTTDVVCPHHRNRFTKSINHESAMVQEHIYNTKLPIFYFCETHAHRHQGGNDCVVQSFRCCPSAVCMKDYTSSFIITVNSDTTTTNNQRRTEYIIYDPQIWREQSFNHFISFIRAVITMPEMIRERYVRFEESNFSISNIKKYKSGKESVVRTAVTGFETKGLYQTATISCLIPYYQILIPQMLYDLLDQQHYDLSLVCVKRDPSIKSTCMFVCKAVKNPDPSFSTIVIPDAISRPMNQDQISIITARL